MSLSIQLQSHRQTLEMERVVTAIAAAAATAAATRYTQKLPFIYTTLQVNTRF